MLSMEQGNEHIAPHREDPVVDGVPAAAEHVHDAPVQLLLHGVTHKQQPRAGPLQVPQHLQAMLDSLGQC